MGRIRTEMEIDKEQRLTLFDSGAKNSYVTDTVASGLDAKDLPAARTVAIGGRQHQVQQACLVIGRLDGHWIEFQAGVVDEIGRDDDGREIEVLFGALAMQLWGIRLNLAEEQLDLSHFSDTFVEF